jgi:hypothetical protein
MARHYFNCFWIEFYSWLVIAFLPCSIPLRMKHFSLLFLLLLVLGHRGCWMSLMVLLWRGLRDTHSIRVNSLLFQFNWTIYWASSQYILPAITRWQLVMIPPGVNTWIERIIMARALPHHDLIIIYIMAHTTTWS